MSTLSVQNPTLLDVTKRLNPEGKIDMIGEILNETNEILEDMTWVEGNLVTGNRSTIRTGLPEPTWRKMYQGVQPTKSTTAQITDDCGMLEAYAEVDKALADLNGNTAAFRVSEDRAHLEGMSQAMAQTLFFGDSSLDPEKFTGLAPRFNDLTAESADNIILGSSASGQTDNTSIWLVVWGPNTVHGIYPKSSVGGIQHTDKGQVTLENVDGNGGRMEAYRTHYRWDCGLTVRDWRYVVRIANIDKSTLTKNASAGDDLIDLMTQAIELLPSTGAGRPVFYCNRTIKSYLRRQLVNKVAGSTLTMDEVAGKKVMTFDGIPVRRSDALAADEARLA
jgi:hypothetical protein